MPDQVRDVVRWLPVADGSVLVLEQVPVGSPSATVVICPSLFWDQISNQRAEVMLTRLLAARGVRCARLQARGCGNALDGSAEVPTLETLEQDVSAVIDDLPVGGPLWIVGFRLSCLVAAALRNRWPDAHLLLWEPSLDGREYLRQSRRADLFAHLRADRSDGQDGPPELHGDPLWSWTATSIERGQLPVELTGHGRVTVASSDHDGMLRPGVAALVEEWRRRARDVEVLVTPTRRKWWYVGDQVHATEENPDIRAAVLGIADVLTRTAAGSVTG